MIPDDRDDRPGVMMTRGEIYAMMEKAVRNAVRVEVHDAVREILGEVADEDRRAAEADRLVGAEAIARALGITRSTLYARLRRGLYAGVVRQPGGGGSHCLMSASRRALLAADEAGTQAWGQRHDEGRIHTRRGAEDGL